MRRTLVVVLMMSSLVGRAAAAAQEPAAAPIALIGAKIHTVSAGTIDRGAIVIAGGKIQAVGPIDGVTVPQQARIVDLSGRVVIPGLVDTHSHVGIYPRPSVPANEDGNEMTGAAQGELRAIDAIWPADPGIRMAQAGGITTANIMPGSGNVMGGQTAYVKMRGRTIDEMLIHREGVQGGMKMANGENPKRAYGSRGQAPSTRMAVAAMQRDIFIRAQAYKKKWDDHRAKIAAGTASEEPARDLELEPVVEILEGRRTVHHHTHRADDIMTVMRLAEEFGYLRNLVLQHVTEAYMVADEIARLRVPCSIIVIDAPGGKHEAAGLTLANGGLLERAGVKVAIHTDDFIVNSRFFLRAGALSVREGMSEAGALAALTINPAEMMGLADRLGSIAAGKDADLVVLSGEPFSVYTQVLQTYIDGQVVFDRSRPEDLRYATGGFAVADRYPGGESGR